MLKEKQVVNSINQNDISRNVSLLVENTEESIRNLNRSANSNSNENNNTNVNSENLNSNIDLRTLVSTQGFSRFREYGMSAEEIHMLRVMFHTNFLVNNRNAPRTSWDPIQVIQREEDWIQQVHQNRSVEPNREELQQNLINRLNLNSRFFNIRRRDENGRSVIQVEVS